MKYKVLIIFLLTLFVIATTIVSTSNMRQTPVAAKPTPTAAKPTAAIVKPTPTAAKPTAAIVKPTPTAAKPTAAKSTYPIMKGNVVPQNFTNRRYTAGIDIPVGLYHSTGTVCGYRINTAENEVFYVTIYEKGSTVVELKKGDQLSNSECSITSECGEITKVS